MGVIIKVMAFKGDSIYWVEVEKIVPNPFQPRREFDEQKLRELADSIRMYGILQPLTVTRREIQRDDGTFYTEYELIAGERRLRAGKLAGLAQVPVIIREGEESEQEKLELAIIENLQREDLNAVDRALAFKQLAEVFGLSHIQVARKVGRSREYVSNSIRLLGLPDYMLTALKQAEISEGHARTLLMLNDKPEEQDVVFREILLKKISVRETESIVRKIAMEKVRKKTLPDFDTQLIEIEKRFMETLGTRVQIQKTEYGGRLTIDYFNVDDLEEMLMRMKAGQPLSNISYTGATLVEATPFTNINLTEGDAPLPPRADEVRERDAVLTEPARAPVDEVDSATEPIKIEPETMPAARAVSAESSHPRALEERPNYAPQSYVPPLTPVSITSPTLAVESPLESMESEPEPLPKEREVSAGSGVNEIETTTNSAPQKPTPTADSDDSNLYSIKNFTI